MQRPAAADGGVVSTGFQVEQRSSDSEDMLCYFCQKPFDTHEARLTRITGKLDVATQRWSVFIDYVHSPECEQMARDSLLSHMVEHVVLAQRHVAPSHDGAGRDLVSLEADLRGMHSPLAQAYDALNHDHAWLHATWRTTIRDARNKLASFRVLLPLDSAHLPVPRCLMSLQQFRGMFSLVSVLNLQVQQLNADRALDLLKFWKRAQLRLQTEVAPSAMVSLLSHHLERVGERSAVLRVFVLARPFDDKGLLPRQWRAFEADEAFAFHDLIADPVDGSAAAPLLREPHRDAWHFSAAEQLTTAPNALLKIMHILETPKQSGLTASVTELQRWRVVHASMNHNNDVSRDLMLASNCQERNARGEYYMFSPGTGALHLYKGTLSADAALPLLLDDAMLEDLELEMHLLGLHSEPPLSAQELVTRMSGT